MHMLVGRSLLLQSRSQRTGPWQGGTENQGGETAIDLHQKYGHIDFVPLGRQVLLLVGRCGRDGRRWRFINGHLLRHRELQLHDQVLLQASRCQSYTASRGRRRRYNHHIGNEKNESNLYHGQFSAGLRTIYDCQRSQSSTWCKCKSAQQQLGQAYTIAGGVECEKKR